MPNINSYPELTTLTDNDVFPGWDYETSATKKIKASTLKTYIANNPTILSVTSGLTAEYKFDQMTGQQLTDSSSNALHGTLGSTASADSQDPTWVDWASAGLDFATNKYVALPTRNWFSGNFYIEAVVYIRSFATWSRIFDFSPSSGSNSGNVYFAITSQSTGRPTFGILEGSQTTFITTTNAIPLNRWLHLAVQFSSGTGIIYLNNVKLVSGSLPTPTNVSRPIAYVGRSQFSADSYLDGIVARLNIYNKALTTQERFNNFAAIKQSLESKGIMFL